MVEESPGAVFKLLARYGQNMLIYTFEECLYQLLNRKGKEFKKILRSGTTEEAGDLARFTWYAVKIAVTATNILLYIDNVLINSWADATYDNLKLGFGRENMESIYVDSYSVGAI